MRFLGLEKKGATPRVAPLFFEFGGAGFQPVRHRLKTCATFIFFPFPLFAQLKNLCHHSLMLVGKGQTKAPILSGKPRRSKRKRRKTLASKLASS